MEVVVIGELSPSRHVLQRIQPDPIHTVHRPEGKIQSNAPKTQHKIISVHRVAVLDTGSNTSAVPWLMLGQFFYLSLTINFQS